MPEGVHSVVRRASRREQWGDVEFHQHLMGERLALCAGEHEVGSSGSFRIVLSPSSHCSPAALTVFDWLSGVCGPVTTCFSAPNRSAMIRSSSATITVISVGVAAAMIDCERINPGEKCCLSHMVYAQSRPSR